MPTTNQLIALAIMGATLWGVVIYVAIREGWF